MRGASRQPGRPQRTNSRPRWTGSRPSPKHLRSRFRTVMVGQVPPPLLLSRYGKLARGAGEAGTRVLEDTVKFKAIAVIAAAAALSLGMAGSAGASPVSHKSKPAPQVTGTRLQSALLPASAFGSGFTVTGPLNTGKKLWSTRAFGTPQTLSCAKFEEYVYVGG